MTQALFYLMPTQEDLDNGFDDIEPLGILEIDMDTWDCGALEKAYDYYKVVKDYDTLDTGPLQALLLTSHDKVKLYPQ